MNTRGSSTALLIAATLVFLVEGRKRGDLVDPEAVAIGDWLLRNYSSGTRLTHRLIRTRFFRHAANMLERLTIPGILEYFAVRKRAISRLASNAFDAGTNQLVVLGAGYDALAARMIREHDVLEAWEIDRPATQLWKRRAVNETRQSSDRLRFVANDFSKGFPNLGAEFSSTDPVFCVAEGLLMYLPKHRVIDLFRWLRQLSPRKCRVAFTFLEPQLGGHIDFRLQSRCVRKWLAAKREPFLWGIPRDEIGAFLEDLGFRLLPIEPGTLQEMDRRSVGEYLVLAETSV
ncbi:MAG TPA: SAM-dependent methyltransferase [Chthoniobacterales bacterium]